MNTKTLIGGAIGGIVLFALGWLIYGILLAGSMEAGACMRAHDAVLPLWIFIGNLFTGLLIAFVFSKIPALSTFGGGAMIAGIMGLLNAIGADCLMYGVSTVIAEPTHILMDALISGAMWAIAGGAIGWWLGRGAKTA